MPNENYDWEAAQARLRGDMERDFAPAWLPVEGEEIIGRLVEVNPSAHTAYGAVPVVTLEGPNGGRRSVWLHHSVLRRSFARLNVQVGEIVAIRYVGKVEPKGGGNLYADYRLAVDREEQKKKPNWNAIAAQFKDDEPRLDEAEPERADLPAQASTDDDIPF